MRMRTASSDQKQRIADGRIKTLPEKLAPGPILDDGA